jgi:hypothetical protein
VERLRSALEVSRGECAELTGRLERESEAGARLELRAQQLDAEIDELRNWISAAESRRRGLFRRAPLPPVPARGAAPRPSETASAAEHRMSSPPNS